MKPQAKNPKAQSPPPLAGGAPLIDGYTGQPTQVGYARLQDTVQIVCALIAGQYYGENSQKLGEYSLVRTARKILKEIETQSKEPL